MAEQLYNTVNADIIAYDDGRLGHHTNHHRVWRELSNQPTPWVLALEDDAIPVHDFREQLDMVLAVAPTPIVSLYLGRSRPLAGWQRRIQEATTKANQTGACWITADAVLHAVGLAVRTELVAGLLDHIETPRRGVDDDLTTWTRSRQHTVGYTWPSIIDHHDGPTLIKHWDGKRRDQPRVAWWCSTRPTWNNTAVHMTER